MHSPTAKPADPLRESNCTFIAFEKAATQDYLVTKTSHSAETDIHLSGFHLTLRSRHSIRRLRSAVEPVPFSGISGIVSIVGREFRELFIRLFFGKNEVEDQRDESHHCKAGFAYELDGVEEADEPVVITGVGEDVAEINVSVGIWNSQAFLRLIRTRTNLGPE
jgi:hypothetical protein